MGLRKEIPRGPDDDARFRRHRAGRALVELLRTRGVGAVPKATPSRHC